MRKSHYIVRREDFIKALLDGAAILCICVRDTTDPLYKREGTPIYTEICGIIQTVERGEDNSFFITTDAIKGSIQIFLI